MLSKIGKYFSKLLGDHVDEKDQNRYKIALSRFDLFESTDHHEHTSSVVNQYISEHSFQLTRKQSSIQRAHTRVSKKKSSFGISPE